MAAEVHSTLDVRVRRVDGVRAAAYSTRHHRHQALVDYAAFAGDRQIRRRGEPDA